MIINAHVVISVMPADLGDNGKGRIIFFLLNLLEYKSKFALGIKLDCFSIFETRLKCSC